MSSYTVLGFLQKETWIPVHLALYAEKNNLIELLKLYVGLKLLCSGKIKAKSKALRQLRKELNIKSRNTFTKRLEALKRLNWVGQNAESGYYFIRSFERVCHDLGIPAETQVEFCVSYFKDFRPYVFAAVVGYKVNAFAYARKKGKEEFLLVPKYWVGTNPSLAPPPLSYNWLSLAYMAELTAKSYSRCSELKTLAEKAQFLATREKLIPVATMPKGDHIRKGLRDMFPDCYQRFKVKMIRRGEDVGKVRILEQMPDEIIPLLRYRKSRW